MVGGMRIHDLNRKYGPSDWFIELDFNAVALPRLLGKIGHCFAVAAFGIDGFTSFVCDAVMKHPNEIGRWVGCLPGDPVNGSSGLHQVRIVPDETSGSIKAFVRLFAQFEAPEYVVLVGRLNERGAARVDWAQNAGPHTQAWGSASRERP